MLGNFQTSPLSLISKLGKLGKYCLVQNLSFPHSSTPSPSINSLVNPDDFPSPYSIFPIVALVISTLPPGSQGAVHNVTEAYRTIPLHHSQWHALIVHLSKSQFTIDTLACFGFSLSGGIYGNIGSTGTDIMCCLSLSPILRWVDDHLFLRIPKSTLTAFNQLHTDTADHISSLSSYTTSSGCSWFAGAPLPCGTIEEYDEDFCFPLHDLSGSSLCPPPEASFCYNINNVDHISTDLGIPWESSKDVPFSDQSTFIRFTWNLTHHTVSLAKLKCLKYIDSIIDWNLHCTYTLHKVQKLHRKLIHMTCILPEGQPFLTNLEAMLSIFGDNPFLPRTPSHGMWDDLTWWLTRLSSPTLPLPIPSPQPIINPDTFCNTSSSNSIGISLSGHW